MRPGSNLRPAGLLTFRSGGWVLMAAGLLVVGIIVWQLVLIYPSLGQRSPGNGHDVASYGFDLSNLLLSREWLAAGLDAKDGLPAMTDPQFVSATTLAPDAQLGDIDKLTSTDRVIGVSIGDESRAYPIWIMNWHEVVNDRVGGLPIAVTYSALSDSVVVFDRREPNGEMIFGVSGLLYNSDLLLYDRRPEPAAESLWYQLQFRAIAGPAANRHASLPLVSAWLGPWKQWHAAHPETRVLLPDPARKARYRQDPYGAYFNDAKLRFPVAPCGSSIPGGLALKTPMRILRCPDSSEQQQVSSTSNAIDAGPCPALYAFSFAWQAAQCAR